MNIGDFASRAQRLVSFNPAGLVDEAARQGVAYSDLLATMADDIDAALHTSADIGSNLKRRSEVISSTRGLINEFGDGSSIQSAGIQPLADELRLVDETGSDELAEAITHVRNSPHLDVQVDSALDQALLLDNTEKDATVETLKASSSLWSDGLLTAQESALEHALRTDSPVNAEAAALLGQPIATLKIPTLVEPGSTRFEWATHRVTPDRIIGPASGFSSLDDARQAATLHVGKQPGTTVVGIRDSRNSIHLLSTPVDSNPRTVVKERSLRKPKARHLPVAAQSNHASVEFVTRSDGSFSMKGSNLESASWPAAHSLPLSPDDLIRRGIAKRHLSIETRLRLAQEKTGVAEHIVDTHTKGLMNRRMQLRDLIRGEESVKDAIDAPGTATPRQWEVSPMITFGDAKQETMLSLTQQFGGFTRALPEATVAEAIQHAIRTRPLQSDHHLTLVLQDSSGVAHLASSNSSANMTRNFVDLHPDIRAIVDHDAGKLWLTEIVDGKPRLRSSTAFTSTKVELHPEALFKKFFQNKRPFFGQKEIYKRYSPGDPIHLLDETNPRDAAEAAARLVSDQRDDASRVFVVNIAQDLKIPRYGVIKMSSPPATYWSGTKAPEFDSVAKFRVSALVDNKGIAWLQDS